MMYFRGQVDVGSQQVLILSFIRVFIDSKAVSPLGAKTGCESGQLFWSLSF